MAKPSLVQLETKLHELSERWVHSDSFLKPAGATLQRALWVSAQARQARSALLSRLGVAVREDLERMHQRVDELERALERAQDRLDEKELALKTLEEAQSQPRSKRSARSTPPLAHGER